MTTEPEPVANPPRLSSEGGMYSALVDLRNAGLSAERLAAGAQGLSKHIASSSSVSTATNSLLLKSSLFVLGVSLAAAAWWILRTTPSQSAETAPTPVLIFHDAGTPPVDASIAFPDARLIEPALTISDAAIANPIRAERPKPLVVPDAAPAPSQLPEQLRLLKEAKALARSGQHKLALERLAELEMRYPDTPLKAEVDLRRAIVLSASGNLAKAEPALRELLNDSRHSGRKAELHHMLVDLLLQQERCEQAELALAAAVATGLSDFRRKTAEAGLARCKAARTDMEQK